MVLSPCLMQVSHEELHSMKASCYTLPQRMKHSILCNHFQEKKILKIPIPFLWHENIKNLITYIDYLDYGCYIESPETVSQ
jgi:hypothetical protein